MPFKSSDLSRALERDEIVPYFQPVVELRTGQLAGFEVLARWNHPQRGTLLPKDFIPLAERSGLIDWLTRILLEKSFADRAATDAALTLSINISPIQLLDLKLPDTVARAAEQGRFPLHRLSIELTESALVDDLQRAAEVAAELKALGCRLALDDFGTGYSSLKHLHALPFDALKVDRSFVNTMTTRRESRKIVASVVGLGQSLGLLTIAEGVETQEQADLLFWMGCDEGQGWLFGRPVPSEELADSAASRRTFPICLPASLSEDSLRTEGPPGQRLAQLQAIYDGAPVGLCMLDRNLRYVSLNRRLAIMNRLPAEAHLGRTPEEMIPEVFRQVEDRMRRALAGETIEGVEIRKPPLEPGKGDQVLMASYLPVRDEAGEVIGISVAIMDVSEYRHTEEALRETRHHYGNMVKLNPHVQWVMNARGEVIEASPRWEEITGQPLEQALGRGFMNALHPDDVDPTDAVLRKALETGTPIDVKFRAQLPQGGWRWLRSRGLPLLSDSGELIAIYGVVEDPGGDGPNTVA